MPTSETVRNILERKSPKLCTVSPEAPVYEALEIMERNDIGAVLVVEHGRLAGLFSERDYSRKVVLHGKASKETRVVEIMSAHPITVTLTHTVDDCMRFMTEFRVRHLPVLENHSILGVISIGDVVNAVIRQQEQEITHLHNYIAGDYPR